MKESRDDDLDTLCIRVCLETYGINIVCICMHSAVDFLVGFNSNQVYIWKQKDEGRFLCDTTVRKKKEKSLCDKI